MASDKGERTSSAVRSPQNPTAPPNRRPFTPCRTVGLKRKSTGTPPLHANVLSTKRTRADDGEAKKRVGGFDEGIARKKLNGEGPPPFAKRPDGETARKNAADKRREIAALESELKNSEQHNLNRIQELSHKWLNVCQEALTTLCDKLNKNQNSTLLTIEELIKNLGIDPNLIHFDSNTQEFY